MAWLEKRAGVYRLSFRHEGRIIGRALKTSDRREAEGCLARFEENLRLLERGRLVLPDDADLVAFLMSDGKLNGKPVIDKPLSLKELFDRYRDSLPAGAKERNTTYTEGIHLKHLLRIIGGRTIVRTLTTNEMQDYVNRRSNEKGRSGRDVCHATIRKELGTFASVWNRWALPRGVVDRPAPTRGLVYQKDSPKLPFQTWKQVERQIERGGLTAVQEERLWDSLFLTLDEIREVLAHVNASARFSFVYPMFVFAAHTGARRSEILRSQVDDFDLIARVVRIREKKRDRTKELTFRHVPMSPLLEAVMTDWFSRHPGGQYTICQAANQSITEQMAAHHFVWAVENSKWDKLRGWHLFRHSFASNCARKGLDQRIIDEWMGHQTDEMRRRYRHLFPDQQQLALASVFGESR
ncbi:MAG: site-specific integrase [Planctomycetes bacterium]|nr:site-specific integrase [Planctomycetota bacterium]